MKTRIKELPELLTDGTPIPRGWRLQALINDDNLTYIASNEETREAIAVDAMREDWDTLLEVTRALTGYRWIAVFDTHTHADHVSCTARLAAELGAPFLMHEKSPSSRVHLRVSRDVEIQSRAGAVTILTTPGHSPDCIVPIWGPFIFGGDVILYGDTGRDDLPGGNPTAHFESLVKIKARVRPEMILLPGHDAEGGRASSWKTQLQVNSSLLQDRESFIRDATAYVGPAPKLLKESLFENSQ